MAKKQCNFPTSLDTLDTDRIAGQEIASDTTDVVETAITELEKYAYNINDMNSAGIVTGGVVTAGTNAGTFKVTAITKALLRSTASATGILTAVTLAEQDNQTITAADTTYFVIFTYGTPCTITISETAPNGYNAIPLGKVMKDSSDNVHYIDGGFRFGDGIRKLHQRAKTLRALELESGSAIEYSGTNNFTMGTGIVYGGLNDFSLSAYNSATTQFTYIYDDGGTGWTEAGSNVIDYAHYDDGDGTLGIVGNNKYSVHYVYKHIDDEDVYVVYGTGSYTLAEAEIVAIIPPTIPTHLTDFGCLIGAIIAPQSGGSFTAVIMVTSQFFSGTEVANHANLANLDYAHAGHTGFAASGANSDITSITGLTTPLGAYYGGTGVANNAANTLTYTGAYSLGLTLTANTSVTLPISGTLYGTKADSITSANLLSSLTDETGTGVAVFGTSPTFTTKISTPQITFPAEQSASADANTLDDYEEGTFTPALKFGGNAVGMTYTTQVGMYTKVGRTVTFSLYIVLSAKGSSVGAAEIHDLPFTVKNADGAVSNINCRFTNITFANVYQGYIWKNMNRIYLEEITEGGVVTNLSAANFADNSSIIVSGVYFTD